MLRSKPSETERQPTTLFPLPFTPFEYYYYLDDRPEYPTVFPVELRFTGTLDRDHFTAALERTLARHPMLVALVDTSGSQPVWIADERSGPFVDWADEAVPISHPTGETIDLREASGLRTWVRTSPTGARVLFQMHHASCDGLSSLQFAADFLASYQAAAGADVEENALRELDAELLRRRGQIVADAEAPGSILTALRDLYVSANVWLRILFQTPEVLAPPVGEAPKAADGSREILVFETESLSPPETVELRGLAKSLKVNSNDLLLRDFLVVLRDWNRRQAGVSRGRLRVTVPVNVRRRDEKRMPAANRIGFGFITSRASDEEDPNKLLAVVRRDMQRIKEWKLGLYFLGGLEIASKMPGVLRWALERKKSFATGVLSNVGRFAPVKSLRRGGHWQCGDLVLDRITGVPPIRPLTRAAVIVIEYGGQTTISLRCDPHFFDRRQTRALLDLYVAQVRQSLGRGGRESS